MEVTRCSSVIDLPPVLGEVDDMLKVEGTGLAEWFAHRSLSGGGHWRSHCSRVREPHEQSFECLLVHPAMMMYHFRCSEF